MSTYQPSRSQASGEPLKPPSQDSFHIYGCKWAWCRSMYSNNEELTQHVILEHARRAIPVRRRDIPLIRRAEDGTGESLRMSYVLNGQSSNSATEPSQKSAEEIRHELIVFGDLGLPSPSLVEPYSSLPSPPASSRANTSPLQNDRPLPGTTRSAVVMDAHISTTPVIHHSWEQDENARSFASLSSPAGSSTSFSAPDIPNSPSFNSLVEKSGKRKLAADAPENPAAKYSKLYRQHPLSQSANSSTGSRVSVEQHLTQSLESEDESEGGRDIDNEDVLSLESSDHEGSVDGLSSSQDAAYQTELPWDISQPEASQSHEATQPSYTQESQFEGGNYDLLSQAPSQFQTQVVESFPFHFHAPKASTSSQMEPKLSAPLHFSPPGPLRSPKYATSTPQRQNWYQPPHKLQCSISQKGDQTGADENQTSSSKKSAQVIIHSQRSQYRDPSKSKKFRSGTLQISPPALSQGRTAEELLPRERDSVHDDALLDGIYSDIIVNHDSQSYMDSSQSLDDYSYPPLQTQAPYESQSMSQF
ncbi:hypothetical protein CVT25_011167 [Psilocybe cyanescens]|uniref:C2H2-type domain-containing protein n=1 Tax=Psilocybe cyanescens TaxID=93625 RepID=A0A409WGU5_PSICY|nr:hypothetical protein CVT25_011167 [Psilocybe cyanescens]